MDLIVEYKKTGEKKTVEIDNSTLPDTKSVRRDLFVVAKDLAGWSGVPDEGIDVYFEDGEILLGAEIKNNIAAHITWFEGRILAGGGFKVEIDGDDAIISISKGFEGTTDLVVSKQDDPIYYDQCRHLAMLMQAMIMQDKDRGPLGRIF